MIVFPIVCSVLSAMCAAVILRDAVARPRPDKIVWTIAFVMFALAAGADAAGIAFGWSTWLARLYYATGPALVVAFLAIGQLYLLLPHAMRRFGVGITLLVTALWVSLVLNAPLDRSRLAEDGWDAIERGPEMVAITVLINSAGTAIIVGGTAWSVWRYWRRGVHRHRMIGCALICAGTLVVAAGGSLTRLGHYEYLYIAMAIGVAMIFGGVLVSRRPERATQIVVSGMHLTKGRHAERQRSIPVRSTRRRSRRLIPGTISPPSADALRAGTLRSAQGDGSAKPANRTVRRGKTTERATVDRSNLAGEASSHPVRVATLGHASALDCVLDLVLMRTDAEIDRFCAEWSVPREAASALSRSDARRAWRLRLLLAPEAVAVFDGLPVGARRQLSVLYHDVLTWERPARDEIAEIVAPPEPVATARQA